MSEFWSTGWAFVFMVTPFLLCQVGLTISLLLTRKANYGRIVNALPKSAWVAQYRRTFGEISFKCRWHLVNTISGALIYPAYVIRKGFFDEAEMHSFPAGLRRFMLVSAGFSIIGFSWLMLAVLLLTLTRPA